MAFWREYHLPHSVDQALALLARYDGRARLVAGGTDLFIEMQQGRQPPVEALVDVTRIAELTEIRYAGDYVTIGAGVTHARIVRSPLLNAHATALVEACGQIGGPQVRNVATLGGNVVHALPAADGTVALMALDAEALVARPGERRWQPLRELFLGPGRSALDPTRELLVTVRFPARQAREGSAFQRVTRPQGIALPILALAVWVRLDDAGHRFEAVRIAMGPAGPVPFRARTAEEALAGTPIGPEAIRRAAELALAEAQLRTSQHRATREYRQEMVGVLLRRALPLAVQRARGSASADHKPPTTDHPVVGGPLDFPRDSPPAPRGRGAGPRKAGTVGWPAVEGPAARPQASHLVHLQMTVNDQEVSLQVRPGAFLAEVLRHDLGLTGTKVGCGEAECGTCTVLVDGEPVLSCVYPAVKAHGCRVETVEGLARGIPQPTADRRPPSLEERLKELHLLQAAFILHGATQCGFCTPGFLMGAKALLDEHPEPTQEQIRWALKGTLCRCGAYPAITRAIMAAARAWAAGRPPEGPALGHPPAGRRAIGRPLPRPDAIAKVTGRATYADDLSFPGMLYGATRRAGVPHARILRIDTRRARELPGVLAVLTHEDIPGAKHHGLVLDDWPVLCYDKVRYVGDAVAIVAAEDPETARRACQLIEVEYDPLPVVDSPQAALAPDAPQVHAWGNLLKHIKVRKGDVVQGFAQAEVVIEETFHTPMMEHAFMEPECSIARPTDDGGIEVYVGSQIPYADRRQIAASLGVPEERVRVIGTVIGGAFGGKEDIAGQIHAALLAQATGRAVKVLYDRRESMLVHPKRHATTTRVKLGARRDGRLIAVEAELLGDTGAYASLGEKVLTRATTHAAGPYDVPHVKIDCYATYTNNPPAGAFRGFGVPQTCFAIESAMDMLAHRLGMDPFQLRRINALREGSTTSTGQVLRESVGLVECLDRVEQMIAEHDGRASGPGGQRSPVGGPLRASAWGVAAAYKNTGLGGDAPDRAAAEVEVFPDGTAEVRTAAAEVGQGLVGVAAQIAAEELGLPGERVRVVLSDTGRTPDAGPTTASRQTFVAGNAVRLAAIRVRETLAEAACEELGLAPDELVFADGFVGGPDGAGQKLSIAQAVHVAAREGREPRARVEYEAPPTVPLGQPGDMHFAFSFGVQAALVEVDLETGEVKVLKVVGAHDVGCAINPLALQGQIEGGIIMGVGQALTEEFIVEKGIPWTTSLARYKVPNIAQTPAIVSHIVEHPTSTGPYGAKGVGELPTIPTAAAICNAIYNAVGVRVTRLPVDQAQLLRAIRNRNRQ